MNIINTPVIDFHSHVGRIGNYNIIDDMDWYIKNLDAAGVDKSFVSYIFDGKASNCNDKVYDFVQKNPKRFGGFAHVTPHYMEEAIPELDRAFNKLDMKALKIYPPFYPRPVNHESWFPIFEWCNENKIPVKSHTQYGPGEHKNDDNGRPILFVDLAQRFPDINWILAHAGNMEEGRIESVKAAIECPNIYLETCSSYGDHGAIEYFVNELGDDRILYGSDLPLIDARFGVGRIVTAKISEDSKRKFLGLNALKVLNLNEAEVSI